MPRYIVEERRVRTVRRLIVADDEGSARTLDGKVLAKEEDSRDEHLDFTAVTQVDDDRKEL
jgi:hypothetical protein